MAYTINLTHRGPQVIECIYLFDEARYGADKLFFRGRFKTAEEVNCQVAIALGGYPTEIENHRADELAELQNQKENAEEGEDTTSLDAQIEEIENEITNKKAEFDKLVSEMGVGNPLTPTPESGDLSGVPTIALNRYHIPNKKFWNNTPPSDVDNPYKASAAVRFSIRVHFRDDFAYIDFGCPWELTDEYGTGSLDESFPALDEKSKAVNFTENFVLLQCHFISKEDALQIIDDIFPKTSENTATYAILRNAPKIIIETTELVDEDGSIIAL
jgi:hypothetical protein